MQTVRVNGQLPEFPEFANVYISLGKLRMMAPMATVSRFRGSVSKTTISDTEI